MKCCIVDCLYRRIFKRKINVLFDEIPRRRFGSYDPILSEYGCIFQYLNIFFRVRKPLNVLFVQLPQADGYLFHLFFPPVLFLAAPLLAFAFDCACPRRIRSSAFCRRAYSFCPAE